MSKTKLLNLDDDNFKSTLNSNKAVLVDFWAPWCGPCKAIAPILEQLAEELEGRLLVAKLNVDDEGEICAKYGVRAIPTMVLFVDGKPVEVLVGMMEKTQLLKKLLVHLDSKSEPVREEPPPPPPGETVWGQPLLTYSEQALIVKALSELEARTMEKRPGCCPEHDEGWEVRLEKLRRLIKRFVTS